MSPHPVPYLTNNASLPEALLQELKKAIENPIEKLSRNQAEIERNEAHLRELKHTNTDIEITLIPYYTVLSPIRRIPPDILREIFFHCLPTQHNPAVRPSEAPLLLTRICRTWREIALSTPRVWARVHIPFSEVILAPDIPPAQPEDSLIVRHARVMDRRCKIIAEWLSRSRDLPLSISLYRAATFPPNPPTFPNHISECSETTSQRLFKVILPFANRWKDLQLSIPWEIYEKLQADLSLETTRMSMLQSLKIDFGHSVYPSHKSVLCFQAPNLQRLSVVALRFRSHLSFKNLSSISETLTVLNCHACFPNMDLLKLLERLPNLVHFKGRLINGDNSGENVELFHPVMVSLPSLISLLVVDGGSVDIMTKIYSLIDAPLVKWVSYQRHDRYRRLSPEYELNGIPLPALPLLQQSVGVKKLSLEQIGLKIEDIICSFRLQPTISHLVIGDLQPLMKSLEAARLGKKYTTENFDLTILIPDENSSSEEIFLPNLLAFEAHNISDLTDATLLRFITSRMNPNSKNGIAVLKFVRVTFNRDKQKDICEEVNRCAKAAGIELELNLVYRKKQDKSVDPLSSTFGLTMDSRAIGGYDLEESDMFLLPENLM